MTKVISLASRCAAPALPSTPELIGLHMLAENALSTALHALRQLDATPDTLRLATARATRAATLLKRASECASQSVAMPAPCAAGMPQANGGAA